MIIEGPFKIWPFPLLNLLLAIISGSTENVETWRWVDYKGRERVIEVHREVRSK
jgi:hypothetical protein